MKDILKIELKGGSIYILDNETLETLRYNGEDYIGAPLSFGEITKERFQESLKLGAR